jgi:hypothetical protein
MEKQKKKNDFLIDLKIKVTHLLSKEMGKHTSEDLQREATQVRILNKVQNRDPTGSGDSVLDFFQIAKEIEFAEEEDRFLTKIEPILISKYHEIKQEILTKHKIKRLFEENDVERLYQLAVEDIKKKIKEKCKRRGGKKVGRKEADKFFDKLVNSVVTRIEEKVCEIKVNMMNFYNCQDEIIYLLNEYIRKLEMPLQPFKIEVRQEIIPSIEKEMTRYNFKEFPTYFEDQRSSQEGNRFEGQHRKLMEYITSQLSVSKIRSRLLVHDLRARNNVKCELMGQVIDHLLKKKENKEYYIPMKETKFLFNNPEYSRVKDKYFMHLILFTMYVFNQNCMRLYEEECSKITFVEDFKNKKITLLREQFNQKYRGLEIGDSLKEQIIYTLIFCFVNDLANKELKRLYTLKIRDERDKIITHEDLMKKIFLEFLQNEPKNEAEEMEFLEKIIGFNAKFKEHKKKYISAKIKEKLNLNIYKHEMKDFVKTSL